MHFAKHLFVFLELLITAFFFPCEGATPKLHERLSGNALEILKNPKYVTLLVLSQEDMNLGDTPIQEVHLNERDIERLKRNLLEDHNYDFTQIENPCFRPEISLKFQDEQEQVLYLFVSFHHHQMLFGMPSHRAFVNYKPAQERLQHFFQELTAEALARNH